MKKMEILEGSTISSLDLNSILAKGLETTDQGKMAKLFNIEMDSHYVSMLDKIMRIRNADAYKIILNSGESIIK